MSKNISIGGGVMADKIKFGRHVVCRLNLDCPIEVAQEFFDLIEAAPKMLEYLEKLIPEDCAGDAGCLHCEGMKLLNRAKGQK